MRTIPLIASTILTSGLLSAQPQRMDSAATEPMMRRYIEFYYPSTGESTYEIIFEWGLYSVITGPATDEKVHHDAEPYKGYLTMRPAVKEEKSAPHFPIYLTTPKGVVWTIESYADIPETKSRKEVTVEKGKSGTTTSTVTIESPLEPIIDHFSANPNKWKKYGTLEKTAEGYKLKSP